jgi:hypothetical protein
MSTPFRTAGRSRTYLSRVTETWADTVLAPDITTAREQAFPPIGDLPEAPRVPPTRQLDTRAMQRQAGAPRTETSVVEARHPEIARAISLLWGFPEMNEYFDRLWLADGGQGPIDPDAMSELMLLSRVHQSIVPQRPGRSLAALYGGNRVNDTGSRPHDPWRDVPPRR